MKNKDFISDEKLNALLDKELDNDERSQILKLMQQDSSISERYCELRRVKEIVAAAYETPPVNDDRQIRANRIVPDSYRVAFASFIFLVIGSGIGWFGSQLIPNKSPDVFFSVEQFRASHPDNDKVLIHINTMDPDKVEAALDTAQQLLRENRDNDIELDIIANVAGLGILRTGSPYTNRITQLTLDHKNVTFKACGIAKSVAALKEGQDISLIPQAKDIPAALDEILMRIEQGWIYVKS